MQHDHVLKKLNFDPGDGLHAKYFFHVAAFVISFNLICNMTISEKVEL